MPLPPAPSGGIFLAVAIEVPSLQQQMRDQDIIASLQMPAWHDQTNENPACAALRKKTSGGRSLMRVLEKKQAKSILL
jgi:hypothetical protein